MDVSSTELTGTGNPVLCQRGEHAQCHKHAIRHTVATQRPVSPAEKPMPASIPPKHLVVPLGGRGNRDGRCYGGRWQIMAGSRAGRAEEIFVIAYPAWVCMSYRAGADLSSSIEATETLPEVR